MEEDKCRRGKKTVKKPTFLPTVKKTLQLVAYKTDTNIN